jgi:hypothetical protein
VTILGNGLFVCNCKGAYTNAGECSHTLAAKHCEKVINVTSALQNIERPLFVGRPKKYVPVGYASHLPTQLNSDKEARKYIGTAVAKRFPEMPGKVFTGRVDDCRFAGKSSNKGQFVFHVTYPPQYEGDTLADEELTLAEIRSGFRLYETYMSTH